MTTDDEDLARGDAVIGTDAEGRVALVNGAAERLTGWLQAHVLGHDIADVVQLVDEATRRPLPGPVRRVLQDGQVAGVTDAVLMTRDGGACRIEGCAAPMRDPSGVITGVVFTFRSRETVHEPQGGERFLAELAAATQPLTDAVEVMATTARLLAEHLDVDRCAYAEVEDQAIFVITDDHTRGVPSIVGRWPVAAFGRECERAMLANEAYVIDDVDADSRAGADLEAYRATNIRAVICVPLHKGGKFAAAMAVHKTAPRHWTPVEIELVRTVVGRSWESIERTRAARGLEQAADRLALAFAAASLGDWSWEAASDVVTLSIRAGEIFGITPEGHVTWTQMQGLLHDDDREHARLEVERSLSSQQQYDVEYRVVRPAGQEIWVSARGRAHYDRDGRPLGMYGVVQDITEKKRLEHELRQRARELAEADRKKDDFIALLAHELRNPLAPIRTALQVMRLAAGDASAVAKARATMDRQLSHMVRLIDDLLDVSRLSRNKLHLHRTRVLLAEVVSNAVEVAGPAVDAAGHDLRVALPADPVLLDADLTRLTQVFGNLITNSAKYTPRGGRISLRADVVDGEAVISVEDNGVGIPAESLPRVFEMFTQVDRSVERVAGGLGIGLALVKGLVEMHDGVVTAESAGPGAGSKFTVRLPIADRPELLPSVPDGEVLSLRGGRRALVVDDYQDGAEAMATLLALLGNEVHVAHDGVEAIELAERVRPDLVLMDIGMPRLDGLEATRQIRARPWGRDVTIIAVTGWGQDSDRERTRAAGCDGHLVKPVSLPQLQELLAGLPRRTATAGPS